MSGMLNAQAALIHKDYQHWWHDLEGKPFHRNKGEIYMLAVSELAEAMEGLRKNLMDDKLPQYPMEAVEIADCAIRLLDSAAFHKLDLIDDVGGILFLDAQSNPAEELLKLVREIWNIYNAPNLTKMAYYTSIALAGLREYAIWRGYELDEIIAAKHAYNLIREDHKIEARKAEGGKKF